MHEEMSQNKDDGKTSNEDKTAKVVFKNVTATWEVWCKVFCQ